MFGISDDSNHPIERGTKGAVDHVDDASTLHCIFDNGCRLGVVPDADIFHIIDRLNVSVAERYAYLLGSAIDGNKRLHNVQEVAEFICKHGRNGKCGYDDVKRLRLQVSFWNLQPHFC